MHLGGRLGAGRHLELDLDAVEGVLLAGFADVERRHDQRHLAGRPDLAQPAAHLPLRAAGQRGPVHVGRASRHRGAGVDVLLHGVFGEVFGRDDRDLARVDVRLRRHAEHAAEVVDVAVGVDDRDDRPVATMRAVQRERGRRRLGGDQRVDDDDAGVALDEADVGQVEAADLVDALDHLVEALLGDELALPPQAGVHRRRRIAVEERVDVVVPHHSSVGGLDDAGLQGADESPVGVLEVGGVVERQIAQVLAVRGLDDGGRRLLVHAPTIPPGPVCDGGLTDRMDVRRVVTGHDASGKSVFVSDEPSNRPMPA